jgi:hypothetical protein
MSRNVKAQTPDLLDVNDDTVGVGTPFDKASGPEQYKHFLRTRFDAHDGYLEQRAIIESKYQKELKTNPKAVAPPKHDAELKAASDTLIYAGEFFAKKAWDAKEFQLEHKRLCLTAAKKLLAAEYKHDPSKNRLEQWNNNDPLVQEKAFAEFLIKFKMPFITEGEGEARRVVSLDYSHWAWSKEQTDQNTQPRRQSRTTDTRPVVFSNEYDRKTLQEALTKKLVYNPIKFLDFLGREIVAPDYSKRVSKPGDQIRVEFHPDIYSQKANFGLRFMIDSVILILQGKEIKPNTTVVNALVGAAFSFADAEKKGPEPMQTEALPAPNENANGANAHPQHAASHNNNGLTPAAKSSAPQQQQQQQVHENLAPAGTENDDNDIAMQFQSEDEDEAR